MFVAAEPCRPHVCWLHGMELIWCHSNISSRVDEEDPSLELSLLQSLLDVFCSLASWDTRELLAPSLCPTQRPSAGWCPCTLGCSGGRGSLASPSSTSPGHAGTAAAACCRWFSSLVCGSFGQSLAWRKCVAISKLTLERSCHQ